MQMAVEDKEKGLIKPLGFSSDSEIRLEGCKQNVIALVSFLQMVGMILAHICPCRAVSTNFNLMLQARIPFLFASISNSAAGTEERELQAYDYNFLFPGKTTMCQHVVKVLHNSGLLISILS